MLSIALLGLCKMSINNIVHSRWIKGRGSMMVYIHESLTFCVWYSMHYSQLNVKLHWIKILLLESLAILTQHWKAIVSFLLVVLVWHSLDLTHQHVRAMDGGSQTLIKLNVKVIIILCNLLHDDRSDNDSSDIANEYRLLLLQLLLYSYSVILITYVNPCTVS